MTMSSAEDKTPTLYGASSYDSVDSQFTEPDDDDYEVDEELRFLEACLDCDDDALDDIIHDGVTYEQVNRRDKSGRVSALCHPPLSLSLGYIVRQGISTPRYRFP